MATEWDQERRPRGGSGDALPGFRADLHLRPSDAAPSIARRRLVSELRRTEVFGDGWSDDAGLFDVLVCVSELVNASVIANSTAMVLRLRLRGRTMRMALLDNAKQAVADGPDARTNAQALALRVFNVVTDQWGIDPRPSGREIWFEFTMN